MMRPDPGPGSLRLLRPDGSVIIPAELAGRVLRILLRDASARVQTDGGELSTGVHNLLWTLHYAAEAVAPALTGSVDGTPVAGAASVEISATEWADRIGCSAEYARRLARSGRVPARRVGRQWLITPGSEEQAA